MLKSINWTFWIPLKNYLFAKDVLSNGNNNDMITSKLNFGSFLGR